MIRLDRASVEALYLQDDYVVLDLETTNLNKGSALDRGNRPVLGVWRTNGESKLLTRDNTYDYSRLVEAVEQASFVVAHNAKFDLQWLQRMGLDLTDVVVFDTMLAEYVILGNRRQPLGLNDVCKRYGLPSKNATVDTMMRGGVCPSEIPHSMLVSRCALDVWTTEQLFLKQREFMLEDGLLPVLFTRCWLTPALADIESNGMYLDAERVTREYEKESRNLAELDTKLAALTNGINPNSPPQVAEYLYDTLGFSELVDRRGKPRRTAKGKRLTDAETIMSLVPETQEQKEFLELKAAHAAANARLSKTLQFLKGVCDEYDGVFFGQFNQAITRTHRLSSSGRPIKFIMFDDKSKSLQFQNFPRVYKPLLTARNEGWSVVECDGSQLEFRIATYLGRDKQGYKDIINKVDVHTFTADTLTEAGQDTSRQEAKSRTFKPLMLAA